VQDDFHEYASIALLCLLQLRPAPDGPISEMQRCWSCILVNRDTQNKQAKKMSKNCQRYFAECARPLFDCGLHSVISFPFLSTTGLPTAHLHCKTPLVRRGYSWVGCLSILHLMDKPWDLRHDKGSERRPFSLPPKSSFDHNKQFSKVPA
jgi:hypothetical protein